MTLNFCTLFDSNYMTRGLAMHQSLVQNCPSFHLYIFAFDSISIDVLKKLNLTHTTVISLTEFEDEALLNVKPTRSAAEYCWTCTPSTIVYCIETYHLDHCTYVDADLLFYSDPSILIDEMGDKSILITEHRYTPEYDQSKTSGKYCVQFMCFKNDNDGITALKWWRDACLDWCYARFEDGKFGDQKYLDDWTIRFKGVHELKHIGGGVAPWNLQQYQFKVKDHKIYLQDSSKNEFVPLVFYHFHGLKLFLDDIVQLSPFYYLPKYVVKNIYSPYINLLTTFQIQVEKLDTLYNTSVTLQQSKLKPYTWKDKMHLYKLVISRFKLKKILAVYKDINSHNYYRLTHLTNIGTINKPL